MVQISDFIFHHVETELLRWTKNLVLGVMSMSICGTALLMHLALLQSRSLFWTAAILPETFTTAAKTRDPIIRLLEPQVCTTVRSLGRPVDKSFSKLTQRSSGTHDANLGSGIETCNNLSGLRKAVVLSSLSRPRCCRTALTTDCAFCESDGFDFPIILVVTGFGN